MSNKTKVSANFISNVRIAKYLYFDYVQTDDPEEKETFLALLGIYIADLGDKRATLIYSKVCDCGEAEKEAYIEILGDTLDNIASEYEEGL